MVILQLHGNLWECTPDSFDNTAWVAKDGQSTSSTDSRRERKDGFSSGLYNTTCFVCCGGPTRIPVKKQQQQDDHNNNNNNNNNHKHTHKHKNKQETQTQTQTEQ